MKKMLFTCLLAIISLAGFAQKEYICTGNNVNVRTGPGMNYPVQQAPGGNCSRGKIQLFKGERYTFTGERRNGFMKIEGTECWPTGYGWVSAQYLRPVILCPVCDGTKSENISKDEIDLIKCRKCKGKGFIK